MFDPHDRQRLRNAQQALHDTMLEARAARDAAPRKSDKRSTIRDVSRRLEDAYKAMDGAFEALNELDEIEEREASFSEDHIDESLRAL